MCATGFSSQDHCDAVRTVLPKGKAGETYNIGGGSEKRTSKSWKPSARFWTSLSRRSQRAPSKADHLCERPSRPRRRYAIDARKIERELGWKPRESFETGMRKTIDWYLQNEEWVKEVTSGGYRKWIATQYS